MRALSIADLPQIVALEQACFTPPVRASTERIRQRLELGHIMIGLEHDRDLIAVVSFSYANFSPDDYDSFPKTHAALTTQPMDDRAGAVFLYNVAIAPGHRSLRHARSLLRIVAERARDDGRTYMVGNSRMPSYAGSQQYSEETIPADPKFQLAIDQHLAGGPFPADEDLCRDPLLAFYRRLTGGSFLWLQTDFAPEDLASGGMGVVLYGRLDETIKYLGGE